MKKQRTLLINVEEGAPNFYYITPSDITDLDYAVLNKYHNQTINIGFSPHPVNSVLNKLEKLKVTLPIDENMLVSEIIVMYRRMIF